MHLWCVVKSPQYNRLVFSRCRISWDGQNNKHDRSCPQTKQTKQQKSEYKPLTSSKFLHDTEIKYLQVTIKKLDIIP